MTIITLHQKIAEYKRTPNPPNQVPKLLQAFSNDDLSTRDLAKILNDFPVIGARLIALANSAWASPAVTVNSIERACLNLGLTVVRSISIGLVLVSSFNVASCRAFDLCRFWTTGKLVAEGSLLLAAGSPEKPEPDFLQTLHTGGLLHNLGLLCLADWMPKETHEALLSVNTTPGLSVDEAIYRTFETGFCEIGGLFAENWGLPSDLVILISQHRNRQYRDQYWQQAALIGAAAFMVGALFNDQQELPPLSLEAMLGIAPTDQQQVFEKLQALLPETMELATALFPPIHKKSRHLIR